jgi:proteasome lid subunit RPN8/RPN11
MSTELPWRMWLSEEAAALLREAAQSALPDETGGVLVGVSIDTRPWVTEAVIVPSEKSSPVYYELPGGARQAAVDEARLRDRRLGYIGEWHSHTYDIGPSELDRSTMARLAESDTDCQQPVLLIARRIADVHTLDSYQQVGRYLRPLRVLDSGPLPPEPAKHADGSENG